MQKLMLFLFLLCSLPAVAIENILGTQYYYNPTSPHGAFMLTLDEDGGGQIISAEGRAPVRWARNGADVTLGVSGPLAYSAPYNVTVDGQEQQVLAEFTIQQVDLSERNGEITADWHESFTYTYRDGDAERAGSGKRVVTVEGMIRETEVGSSAPASVRFQITSGTMLALPVPMEFGYWLLEFNDFGSGRVAQPTLDGPSRRFAWALARDGRQLSIRFDDGYIANYHAVSSDGIDMSVLAVFANREDAWVVQNVGVALDKRVSPLSKEDVVGRHEADFFAYSNPYTWEFGEDGTVSALSIFDVAAWDLENGLLVVRQYRVYPKNGVPYQVRTKEELNQCRQGQLECHNYMKRTYRLLNIHRDKRTFLRTMAYAPLGEDVDQMPVTTNVQYFEKAR